MFRGKEMRNFLHVQDLGDLKLALAEAQEIKKDRYKYVELGRNKTALLVFFNNSLRTRLSTQKAALNLGIGDRAWRHYGWRQERAPAGGHSRYGLLLRYDWYPLFCRTHRPRVRLCRDCLQPICKI